MQALLTCMHPTISPNGLGENNVRNPFNINSKRCLPLFSHFCTGPLLRVSKIAVRGTEDFSSPELLTGMKLYEDCEYLDDLGGEVRDVMAADAWSIGAIIFNAATGVECTVSPLVQLLYRHKCDTGRVCNAHVCVSVPHYTHTVDDCMPLSEREGSFLRQVCGCCCKVDCTGATCLRLLA